MAVKVMNVQPGPTRADAIFHSSHEYDQATSTAYATAAIAHVAARVAAGATCAVAIACFKPFAAPRIRCALASPMLNMQMSKIRDLDKHTVCGNLPRLDG